MYCKENWLKERPELFVKGDSVRPGILVLINEADWELRQAALPESALHLGSAPHRTGTPSKLTDWPMLLLLYSGREQSALADGDVVVFISTLHGG